MQFLSHVMCVQGTLYTDFTACAGSTFPLVLVGELWTTTVAMTVLHIVSASFGDN